MTPDALTVVVKVEAVIAQMNVILVLDRGVQWQFLTYRSKSKAI